MVISGLVKARIAAFENMTETGGLKLKEAPVPTGSVKSLIRFFEAEVAVGKSEVQFSLINSGTPNEDVNGLIPVDDYLPIKAARFRFEERSKANQKMRTEENVAASMCSVDRGSEGTCFIRVEVKVKVKVKVVLPCGLSGKKETAQIKVGNPKARNGKRYPRTRLLPIEMDVPTPGEETKSAEGPLKTFG